MAKKKSSKAPAASTAPAPPPSAPTSPPFPLAQYASVLPTHTLLLLFTVFYLPRSSSLFFPLPPPTSSLDHPQPPWMEPLTASPAWTLLWIALGAWGCLGAWAGSVRRWSRAAGVGVFGNDLLALRNACAALALSTPLYFLLAILFGAPYASHLPHTLLLSLLLALFTAYVPAYVLPPPAQDSSTGSLLLRYQWTRLFSEFSPRNELERILVYPAITTLVGAWAGAMPIALDWDRPWQAWPLTPAYGAVFGYVVGAWAAFATSGVLHLAAQDRPSPANGAGKAKTS